jgi:hypothetical protein
MERRMASFISGSIGGEGGNEQPNLQQSHPAMRRGRHSNYESGFVRQLREILDIVGMKVLDQTVTVRK